MRNTNGQVVGEARTATIRATAGPARRRAALAAAALAGVFGVAGVAPAATVTDTYVGPPAGDYNDPANWSLGFVPNNGNNGDTYNVVIDARAQNSVVTAALNPTVNNLTVNAGDALNVNNGTSFQLVGDGTNATIGGGGTVSLASTADSYTDLLVGAPTVTVNNATITLAQAARVRNGTGGAATLANVSGVIQGETSFNGGGGTLGNNDLSITNGGTINANVNGQTLNVDPANTNAGLTNTGLMEATNGGTLLLNGSGGGGFTNTGGTTTAGAGSTVAFVNGAVFVGGTLSSVGTGQVVVPSGQTAYLSFPTINGTLNVNNGGAVSLGGTVPVTGGINLQSTADSFTDLLVSGGTVTLGGTGTLSMSQAARVRSGGGSTPTLTIGPSFTVQGESSSNGGGGTFGNNDVDLVVNGTVNANSSGNVLYVDPAPDAGLVNHGLLEATNGGVLQLSGSGGGAFANTGATITAGAGSQVQLVSSAAITGGTLNAVGTGTFATSGGGSSLTGLTLAAPLTVTNGTDLGVAGTITNTSTINLSSTSDAFTDLLVNGNTTLAGAGTVTFSQAARVRSGGGTPTLTLGAGQAVQGETSSNGGGGSFGNNDVDLVVNGLVNANVNGQSLLVDPAADAGLVNNGTLEATNGGTLVVTGSGGGAFANATGTITAATGSTVLLLNSATVNGGTLSATGTGTIQVSGGGSSINGLTKSGPLVVQNGGGLTVSGTITNTGDIDLASTSDSSTDLLINGNTLLAGTGTVTMTQAARVRSGGGTPTLTVGANQTVQGETSSNGGGGSFGNNDIDVVLNGTVNANVNGQSLLVDPAADAGLVNHGLLEATGGGVLVLSGSGGGGFANAGATITAGAGSQVQLVSSAAITGGTINSGGSGATAGTVLVVGGGSSLADLTNAAPVTVQNGGGLIVGGTITNTGSIAVASTTDTYTDLLVNGDTTLAGTGTVTLSQAARVRSNGGTPTLTIGAGQTVQGETTSNGGGGTLGNNDIALLNQGTVNANVAGQTLLVDPAGVANAFVNDTTGVVTATNGGTAHLSGSGGGAFTNNGTFDAEDGSAILVDQGSLTNFSGTTLTGGVYRAVATAGTATINLDYNATPSPIVTNAADVTLSGARSVFAEIDSIATNNGSFRLLNNRGFTTVGNFANNGLLQLGGGTFDVAPGSSLTNAATGTIQGYGTVVPRPANGGLVRATGGTLAFNNGVGSAGTLQVDPAATLSLAAGSQNSVTNTLTQNGTLALGTNNVTVNSDYTNANFGVGNAFNPRANVTGSGLVLASGNANQGISVNGGTPQTTATVTVPLGNFHVGGTASATYAVVNTGTTGPSLRGAIQTAVNGGNITSGLTGTGATAANFGPLAPGASTGNLTLTYTGTTAGPLAGQQAHVESNFDNVRQQNVVFTGAAYRLAAPSVTPTPVNFGIVHVGDPLARALTVTNGATADGYSENLDAAAAAATGNATDSGSVNGIAPGGSNTTAIVVGLTSTTAGVKTGTATISLTSDGTGTSGLGDTALTAQVISLTATVDNYADALLSKLGGAGTLVEVNPTTYTLDLGVVAQGAASPTIDLGTTNDATGPADTLAGSFSNVGSAFALSAAGPFAGLGAGSTFGGPDVSLSTAMAGVYSSSFTLSPRSQNASGYDGALSAVTINVTGTVGAAVPEPGSLALLAGGAASLALGRRRRPR